MAAATILKCRGYKSSTFAKELEETSLDQYLINCANQRGYDIYLVDAVSDERLTTLQFLQRSFALAAELQQLGCVEGTVVGISSPNRLEYAIVTLSTLMLGGVITCFNPYHSAAELKYTFGITKPTIMFSSPENYDKVRSVAPPMTKIVVFDTDFEMNDENTSLLRFSKLSASTRGFIPAKPKPDDAAVILYSGGTTGWPKGVTLTHRNLVFTLKLINEKEVMMFGKEEHPNQLTAAPMFHATGFVNLFSALAEKTLVIMEKFETKLYFSMVQKYEITHLMVVPAWVEELVQSSNTNGYDLSSIKTALCGGGALKPALVEAFKGKFGLEYVQEMYGLPECTLLTTMKDGRNTKKGTCGSAIPGVELKVVEMQMGTSVGMYEIGEICVRGPHVMKGYYDNERATRKTFEDDGWLHTGDTGYYDVDGDFFIIDRIQDVIKYKNFEVSPTQLQRLLETHAAVRECAVIGVPDEDNGELPRAYVVKLDGFEITEGALVKFVEDTMPPSKRLYGGVEFVSSIPRNEVGKILRAKLRDTWKRTHIGDDDDPFMPRYRGSNLQG